MIGGLFLVFTKFFKEAIKIRPSFYQADCSLIETYIKLGRYEKAFNLVTGLITRNPNLSQAYLLFSQVSREVLSNTEENIVLRRLKLKQVSYLEKVILQS